MKQIAVAVTGTAGFEISMFALQTARFGPLSRCMCTSEWLMLALFSTDIKLISSLNSGSEVELELVARAIV